MRKSSALERARRWLEFLDIDRVMPPRPGDDAVDLLRWELASMRYETTGRAMYHAAFLRRDRIVDALDLLARVPDDVECTDDFLDGSGAHPDVIYLAGELNAILSAEAYPPAFPGDEPTITPLVARVRSHITVARAAGRDPAARAAYTINKEAELLNAIREVVYLSHSDSDGQTPEPKANQAPTQEEG